MGGGRRKLPVLAEVSIPARGDGRAWSLRRTDLDALAKLQEGFDRRSAVLVSGDEALGAAIALAGAAGAAGRRTALLECDLARPRLAAALGLAPAPGLHEYLRWEATAPRILQPLVLAGPAAGRASEPLVCVVGGRPTADAPRLIALDSFRHALAKLRAAYDLVVLAGPALDAGGGSLETVASQADTLLTAVAPAALVGRAGRGLRAALRRLPVETRGAILVGDA